MRKVFKARIAHLPYAEQRQITEALREMSNERNSRLAQEGKRAYTNANPVQSNTMSDAVGMRGQEPPVAPRKINTLKKLQDTPRQLGAGDVSERLGEQANRISTEKMTGQPFNYESINRPVGLGTEKLANDAAYGAESRIGRMGGQLAGVFDHTMENTLSRVGIRGLGRAVPVLGDLVLPYGSIDGGEMYPAHDGLYYSAVGGELPPQLQQRNQQEMQRRVANDSSLTAAQTQRYQLEDPNYAPRVNYVPNIIRASLPTSLQTNMGSFLAQPQQQYQEPQSIAQTLSSQESNQEPQSIAQQLSQSSPIPESQYTNSPQVSIAKEIPEPSNVPKSLMDHYVKIYGSPEHAREAMVKTGVYDQSQVQ